jgi:N-acylneuraminate cytidylyltransferase
MWRISEDTGFLEPLLTVPGLSDCQSSPRQQLPMVYWQNGYVDVLRPRAVLEKNRMWGGVVLPFIVQEPVFELDYPEDIPRVEEALRLVERDELPAVEPDDRHPV